jgi:hypothetical protein
MRKPEAGSTCLNRFGKPWLRVLLLFMSSLIVIGCAGTRSFNEYARAGDTVAIPTGWKQHFSPDNITVTITPSTGVPVVYQPADPAIKGVVNVPIDPLSSMVVSRETDIDQTPHARTYSSVIQSNFTGNDKDWWQTVVFLDLPQSLPLGQTRIDIENTDGEWSTARVEIIDGIGQPHTFSAEMLGPMTATQRQSLLRVANYTVSFSGLELPQSIQLDMSHDPDIHHGGVGHAHVVNPIGYIKNAAWSDDGFTTRVLLTPAREASIKSLTDYKFYVAGGLENLAIKGLRAFDSAGFPVSGISASITYND